MICLSFDQNGCKICHFLLWWLELGQVADSHPAPSFHSSHKPERQKMKRACRFEQYIPSTSSSSQAQLHSFIPNFSTFSPFQAVQEDEEGWGHSQSIPAPFCCFILFLFSSGHLHGLHVKTCSNMGSPWTTNHLGNIHCSIVASSVHSGCLLQHGPPMGCRTTPAQSRPLPQAAEDFLLCSSSSSIYTAYVNKLAKMPNHNTYHYIHVL